MPTLGTRSRTGSAVKLAAQATDNLLSQQSSAVKLVLEEIETPTAANSSASKNNLLKDIEIQRSSTPKPVKATPEVGIRRSLTPTNLTRVVFEKTYSPSRAYDQPAGQPIVRCSSRKKAVECFEEPNPDCNNPIAAGVRTCENGRFLDVIKVDNVANLIKDKTLSCATRMDTTYNRKMSKENYSPSKPADKLPDPDIKIIAPEDVKYTSALRHPFEVKSNIKYDDRGTSE